MKRTLFILLALTLLLCSCSVPQNQLPSDTTQTQPTSTTAASAESTAAPTETTQSISGWQEDDQGLYYLYDDGNRATGWLENGSDLYFLDENGYATTGWYSDGEKQYYFLEDGSMAKGQVQIDGVNHFFTSAGQPILVVNPWNALPEGYEPDLVELDRAYSVEDSWVDRSCYQDLVAMLTDCNVQCPSVCVVSSYRTHEYQTLAYNNKVDYFLSQGYSQEDAEKEAGTIIAVPGTSEHQLGLAVDIIDTQLWALEEEQADLPAQQWLMENCWRYGFVLRYPKDKTDETGIIYEPWHYRYVGHPVAEELHLSGMTLEAYLESIG